MSRRDALGPAITELLNDDPALPLDQIEVTVADDHVLLTGSVEWRYESERIEFLVERAEGVTAVANEIAVTPVAEANEAIAGTIAAAAAGAGAAEDADVRVEANGEGTLTLLGSVRFDAAYRAALATAWAVPGVQNVRDELTVDR